MRIEVSRPSGLNLDVGDVVDKLSFNNNSSHENKMFGVLMVLVWCLCLLTVTVTLISLSHEATICHVADALAQDH